MEVILKEDVPKLGSRGDVVKVAEGYGRNYLLPHKLAIEANAANKAVIDQMRAAANRRSEREKGDAETLAAKFADVSLTFRRKAGEKDHLFGSVTSSEIAEELAKKGLEVDRRKIQLTDTIKTLGEHNVTVKLHRDVPVSFKVVVEKEAE
ncbi:MAG: 50S ribosomal protein L9 [Candidatus Koribacter versatilis]|uniref:Large ribosomal subunit protein bL9 n=1 Tax=Candidatus Korobacter versatilis TaxID=658062 RepID=A0A932A7T5_9BACT|nr:50S ribosomal protein L9 [Candidatus Koribacter versatilis]